MIKLEEIKVFRDPLYTNIKVEYKVIWDLINTSEFQRLRRIKQLGGANVVFHTAEHSRFSHSMGVYHLATCILNEVTELTAVLTEKEQLALLCSALLHDVGHGPFSHTFEGLFKLSHEEYTSKIILENTSINKILLTVSDDFPDMVASIIEHRAENKLLESVISSQIDIDRADYLNRDSYFTGVKCGGIDIIRLMRVMRLVDGKLVSKESGVPAIENFLLSRYHMYWQVYLHPTAISYEIVLDKLFLRVSELIEEDFDFVNDISILKKLFTKEFSTAEYLELDDFKFTSMIKDLSKESDVILKDLSSRIIDRRLFKDQLWFKEDENGMIDSKYKELEKLLESFGIETKYYLSKNETSSIAYGGMKSSSDKIKILKESKEVINVEEHSEVVKGLMEQNPKIDYRIFYPKDFIEKLNKNQQKKFNLFLEERFN